MRGIKVELDITEEDLKKALIQSIAESYRYKVSTLTDKMFEAIDWSEMTPQIQELILKEAAKSFFKRGSC